MGRCVRSRGRGVRSTRRKNARRCSPPWPAWIFVTIFDEPRATRLLSQVRPHVYVKGGDYRLETLDAEERGVLLDADARIEFVPMVPGRSTTRLVEAMQRGPAEDA